MFVYRKESFFLFPTVSRLHSTMFGVMMFGSERAKTSYYTSKICYKEHPRKQDTSVDHPNQRGRYAWEGLVLVMLRRCEPVSPSSVLLSRSASLFRALVSTNQRDEGLLYSSRFAICYHTTGRATHFVTMGRR